jgi:hypothetical protein
VKAHAWVRGAADTGDLAGRVLCHDVRDDKGRIVFRKGDVLRDADVSRLHALPWEQLHLIELENGELHEHEAGRRIATAAAGQGVQVGTQGGGAWPLLAAHRGILDVDVATLRRVNLVDGVAVYTLYSGQVIDEGEAVARAKVIPFVLSAERVREAERIAEEVPGVIRVRLFRPMRIGAVTLETLGEGMFTRYCEALAEKVTWFGSELLDPLLVGSADRELRTALERLTGSGAEVIIVAGARTMDPLDPVLQAMEQLGIVPEQHGVPAHPGSLFWVAHCGEIPILGMPGCGILSRATVFDLIFPRILAGERIGKAELAELGHGGFLTRDMAFRFPPYRPARDRGEVE